MFHNTNVIGLVWKIKSTVMVIYLALPFKNPDSLTWNYKAFQYVTANFPIRVFTLTETETDTKTDNYTDKVPMDMNNYM